MGCKQQKIFCFLCKSFVLIENYVSLHKIDFVMAMKRKPLSGSEQMKNNLYTSITGLKSDAGKKGTDVDVAFIFNCIAEIVRREGRTKRFVLMSLLSSGLQNSEIFKETYEDFRKEWLASHPEGARV